MCQCIELIMDISGLIESTGGVVWCGVGYPCMAPYNTGSLFLSPYSE